MARNTGASTTWEERSSSAVQKDRAYLRGPAADGFYHLSSEGPDDAFFVEDTDGFHMMTLVPDLGQTAAMLFEIGGFVYII